ncbi:MAG: Cytochrome c4 [Steroidobacteraceae bacterium]|nr:Cytochrome c4 [Steroidobacteraceae bacterium]
MTKTTLAFAALALAAALPAARADGSAEAGASKAIVCTACHGPNGNSVNPEWPNLAGQNAAYITQQLTQFRAGQRGASANAMVMTAQAAALTDADIADLAAYFSAQTPAGLEADPSYWKAGEALYRGGSHERGIPACMACHGPVGRGNPAAGYPAVRAQHSVYTVAQLTAYANGTRYSDAAGAVHDTKNAHMMETIAKQLTAEDMRDLASYIQGMR